MMNNSYSPVREHEHEQEGVDQSYVYEEPSIWCGCFKFPCFQSQEGEANSLLQERGVGENRESWIVKKMKELKEYSEVVAGPKWKNFVRKIGKYCNPNNNNKKKTQMGFQYDSQSYALNFDEGIADSVEDDGLLRNFSSRFAAPFSVNPQRNTGL